MSDDLSDAANHKLALFNYRDATFWDPRVDISLPGIDQLAFKAMCVNSEKLISLQHNQLRSVRMCVCVKITWLRDAN